MSKRDIVICVVAIIVLLTLIFDFVGKDTLLSELSTEQIEIYRVVSSNEDIILELESEIISINAKLDRWDNIDMRWIYWIEENWELVKAIEVNDGN